MFKNCPLAAPFVLLCLVFTLPLQAQPSSTSSNEAIEQYRVAQQYQKLGEYDLAAAEWQKLVEAYPQDPLAATAVHSMGVCQYQLGNYAKAAEHFATFVEKYPQHELAEASLTNLGLAHYNLAQKATGEAAAAGFRSAISALDRLRKEHPGGKFAAQGDYYRAESLYALGELRDAEAAYRQWLEDHHEHGLANDVRLALGSTQTELGEAEQAVATLWVLVQNKPEGALGAEASLRLGDALMAAGKPAEAVTHYATAANVDGFADAPYALEQQGAAHFTAGDFKRAAEVYTSFPERFPNSPRANACRAAAGKCYYQLKDYEQAAGWLGEAVAADPQNVDSIHWYARSLLAAGEAAKVVEALDKLPVTRESARLLLDRADALYESEGRRAESIDAYVAAAAKGEGELAAESLHLAAATALELGNSQQAADLAERVIKELPDSTFVVDAQQTLAEAQMQLGDHAAAAKLYQELLASAPDAQKATWTLRLAWAQSGSGDEPGVVATLTPLVDSLPGVQKQEAQYLLGRALLAGGDTERALGLLQAAQGAQGVAWSADAGLQLARAQQLAGQLPEALATLDRLLQQNPPEGIAATALFRRAEVKQKSGDRAGARADYGKLAAQAQSHVLAPYALYRDAMLALEENQGSEAAQQLNRFIAQWPDHKLARDARLALGTALAKTKDYAKAIETLTAVASATDYASRDRALYELAWAYREGQQPDKAIDTFAALAKGHPQSPYAAEAHYRLGEALYAQEKWQEAAKRFRSAIEVPEVAPPLGEKSLHMAAWCELKQGEPLKAAESFAAQVKAHPRGSLAADGRWMQAEALFQAEKPAEALAAYDAARDSEPTAAELAPLGYLHAGQAAAQLEKWQESADWLSAAKQKFPDYAGKHHIDFEWGVAQWKLGNSDEAREAFTRVADGDASPLGARAQFMLGELQFAAKEYEAAVRSFFKVSSGYQAPNSPEGYHPWQAESLFEAARCLEQLQRTAAAKKLYSELVTRFPQQPKAGLAQQRLEELAKAGQ